MPTLLPPSHTPQIVKEQKLDRIERWAAATLARPSALKTRPSKETIIESWKKHLVYRTHD